MISFVFASCADHRGGNNIINTRIERMYDKMISIMHDDFNNPDRAVQIDPTENLGNWLTWCKKLWLLSKICASS